MILIRAANIADVEALVQFNIALAQETENKILDKTVVTKGVSTFLQHPEFGFYLIAQVEDEVAGALMITSEWSDWRAGHFWWFQSVYVQPKFRRQGVFGALYDLVVEKAHQQGNVVGLRLYVEQENKRAQETYLNLGMAKTDYHLFEQNFSR